MEPDCAIVAATCSNDGQNAKEKMRVGTGGIGLYGYIFRLRL
jgi:hypothetical protein